MKHLLPLAIALLCALYSNAQSHALDFDGSNDQVSIPNASSRITNGTGITLSFWVYPTNSSPSFPNFDGFAGFRNNASADFYILQLSSTSVEARFRNSSGVNVDIVQSGIAINTWQHYVLTYNGSTLALYRNGSLQNSASASGSISLGTETLYAGVLKYQTTDFLLDGKLDDLSLWSRALTASEVSCMYQYGVDTSMTGLELYYACDQGKAGAGNPGLTTLNDDMGNINGTLSSFSLSGSSSNWVNGVNSFTYETGHICEGDSFLFGNNYVKQQGRYRKNHSVQSCDSIVQLELKVHGTDSITKNHRICKGDSVAFNGQYLKDEGTYILSLTSQYGCDSVAIKNIDVDTVNVNFTKGGNKLVSLAQNALYQWYNCDGDSIIPSETGQTFEFTTHASYAVIVRQNNCVDTSECLFTALGLEDYQTSSLSFYPNPASDYLQIQAHTSNGRLYVYDLSMKLVKQEALRSDGKLFVGDLISGTYILELRSEHSLLRGKLLIQ